MARRKTTRNTKSTKRKTTRTKSQKPILSGIPSGRRVDIFAILFIVIGALTLIALFSKSEGTFTSWWKNILLQGFGWGVYILPIVIIVFGLWMLLRNIDRFPRLSPERVIGAILFFINLLAWFHLIVNGNFQTVADDRGGGFIGAAIKVGLEKSLGKPGLIIALVAWLFISLILALDLTMANVVKWIGKVFKSIFAKFWSMIKSLYEKLQERQETKRKLAQAQKEITGTAQNQGQDLKREGKKVEPESMSKQDAESSLTNNQGSTQPVWVLPDPEQILDPLLQLPEDTENDRQRARVIEETLRSFGAPAHVVEIRRGPTITLFGIEPDFVETRNGKTRVRVSKITSLADDLALALAASRIRIQAPVPGKGYIGIEVPNQQVATVSLREVITSTAYQNLKSPLKIALGKDVAGKAVAADLTAMPHLLIAGTTGAGKSVCINDILVGFLLKLTPDQLRMVLVDPKRVELTGYNGIPHLISPVIVDAEHVVGTLKAIMREMDIRYRKFSETGTRNIADYNAHCEQNHEKKIPYILLVIDELADLMLLAPDETERAITRLAQLARATGIHLIIATQRPSTDILTGLIKANFPARIAFAVASSVDSRVILDQPGAERLLGRGDMLFQAPDAPAPIRIQTPFVSENEIYKIAAYWRSFTVSPNAPQRPDLSFAFAGKPGVHLKQEPLWEQFEEDDDLDPRFDEAFSIIKEEGQASISMLQRKMRIGYTRAARIIDSMQQKGLISEPDPKTQLRTIIKEINES